MRIFVGNIPYTTTGDDLSELFGEFGEVNDARVITDRGTGRSKGFGFVDMPNDSDANEAMKSLNGSDFNGRPLTVNEARPRNDGPRDRR
ncbi:MAG: RNA-binding protein [Gammaproteobacteria bacterium]|nr:RNA-binding protein [Gammaproteobacteria bacterium]MCH2351824.1 RNA-binding protein [Pseudomonadales bacterium]